MNLFKKYHKVTSLCLLLTFLICTVYLQFKIIDVVKHYAYEVQHPVKVEKKAPLYKKQVQDKKKSSNTSFCASNITSLVFMRVVDLTQTLGLPQAFQ